MPVQCPRCGTASIWEESDFVGSTELPEGQKWAAEIPQWIPNSCLECDGMYRVLVRRQRPWGIIKIEARV